jgi:hypothetical protein
MIIDTVKTIALICSFGLFMATATCVAMRWIDKNSKNWYDYD